jgi:hypothetical protein
MIEVLRVTWRSAKDYWEDFLLLLMLNIIWSLAILVILVPLFLLGASDPGLALIVALLLSWPLPIVSGALCFVTNRVARERVIGWGTFFTGIRRYWSKSLIVALINVVVLLLIAININFYMFILQGTWTNFAVSAWVIVGIYWLLTQIYWFPLILELESEKVLLALRNSLVMVIVSPGFTLLTGVMLALLIALSVALTVPVVLFMTGLLLIICNRATRSRLAHVQSRYPGTKDDGNGEA